VKSIQLVPLAGSGGNGFSQEPALNLLEQLAAGLARAFRVPCRVSQRNMELDFALDGRRGQYYSSAILQQLDRAADSDSRVLGVTSCDLYVPVLTFVFGEAQLDGNCAVGRKNLSMS
jgi:archaemetzincin